jgi:mRNA-degrading endonuclease toxin of MazEF toxin-antitoxin module
LPSPQPAIRHGRIIFAWIKDRNGHGKLRPALVLGENVQVSANDELTVMAITTTFANPPPKFCVPLPWHPRGHPVTRLHQRSAAVANWLSMIHPADIVGYGGDVPSKTMRLIEQMLQELSEEQ